MNVSIATVAKDVGTTVTGIQTAITMYTLVMASLMITGGEIGQIWGRKRAFAIGCVIFHGPTQVVAQRCNSRLPHILLPETEVRLTTALDHREDRLKRALD